MSIRLRLTLLYTVILAATLAVLGGILYGTQFRALRSEETRLLAGMAWRATEMLQHGWAGFGTPFGDRPLDIPPAQDGPERRFGNPDAYAQWIDADGQPLLRSANLDEVVLPLTSGGMSAIQRGESWVEVASVEGERLLIYSAPVMTDGQISGAVQVAHSLAAQDAYLATLRNSLLVACAIAVLVAFGSGWLLSGQTLRPIERITRTARIIGADRDLSRRVEYRGPNDELGQLATTFNAMLAELETAHRQQQRFVADVSHELRTPLTTLSGNIELLRRQPPISTGDRDEVLADMTEESKRLIRLVNALLTLARADARQPLKMELLHLRPLIEDVCRQVALLAPNRTIVHDELADEAVTADGDGLKQILLILLDNAVKYTEGPVTVSVERVGEAGAPEPSSERIAVRIRDSGPGIDPAVLPHIFDRFCRADQAREKPGFGLGLSIAKALVEAQGGTIALESDLERGSLVTLTLQRAPVPASAEA